MLHPGRGGHHTHRGNADRGLRKSRSPSLRRAGPIRRRDAQVGSINSILYVFYALLALSVITAVMGAVLGVVIGVLFGVLISRPLGSEGFVLALPYATLVVLLVLGALAGVVAAIVPARRASRVDVLGALTHQ